MYLRRAGRERSSRGASGIGVAAALVAIDTALIVAFDWGGAAPAGLVLLALALSAAAWLRWKRPGSWRVTASWLLAMALLLEVLAVNGLGTFLRGSMSATDSDYLSRREHWSDGVSLMG